MRIFKNSIMTPDGTILVSYDYKLHQSHMDENGEFYFIDGGTTTMRRSSNIIPYKELSITENSPHKQIREEFRWGSIPTKPSSGMYDFNCLKSLSDNHIKNILITEISYIAAYTAELFRKELIYRSLTLKQIPSDDIEDMLQL